MINVMVELRDPHTKSNTIFPLSLHLGLRELARPFQPKLDPRLRLLSPDTDTAQKKENAQKEIHGDKHPVRHRGLAPMTRDSEPRHARIYGEQAERDDYERKDRSCQTPRDVPPPPELGAGSENHEGKAHKSEIAPQSFERFCRSVRRINIIPLEPGD